MPNLNAQLVTHVGAFDQSAVSDLLSGVQEQLVANVTTVTNVNPTSATTMMSATVGVTAAGAGSFAYAPLNSVGKALELFCAGTYNCGTASTLVFTIVLGGVTVATFTTASQTNTSVTLNWNITLVGITATTGAAGTMEWHGELNFDSGATAAAATTTFQDSNSAAITALALNAPILLSIQSNFGSTNASNTISQRLLSVQLNN